MRSSGSSNGGPSPPQTPQAAEAASPAEGEESQGGPAPDGGAERLAELREEVQARAAQLQQEDGALLDRPLHELNASAAAAHKRGDSVGAAATYSLLFAKAARLNLTHPELYVCHSNCAGVYLDLGLHEDALRHAERCRQLAEASLRRNFKGSASYIKALVRKGRALLGLRRPREAVAAFEAGLKLDAFNLELKAGLQEANEAALRDLVDGRGREIGAIEYPEPGRRITFHPYTTPLHRIKTEDMLPLRLLTPFQAENDHHIKDTYNYVTVQTDIRMPRRQLLALEDAHLHSRFCEAIAAAVGAIEARDMDCRVLNLGAGAGLHAAAALRAGAVHVTAVERWLYLALACKEVLAANQFSDDQYTVVYKRPTDLTLRSDVPVCCNLLLANVFDEGLLTSGLIPAVNHALAGLLTANALLVPCSATVYVQAVELRTTDVCGFDMSAVNQYRWHPAYAAGVPLAHDAIKPLSEPVEAWYFDLGAPPTASDVKTIDLEFTRPGRCNAVLFWYRLHLHGDVYLSTGPEAVAQGLRSLGPALQYLAGELPVEPGLVLPMVASHNTVRMRFDIESADYLHLHKPDASFPHRHYSMLADVGRCEAYQRAIARAVRRHKQEDGEAHVLDLGCGTGILSLMAARAGASSVVACDLHESLCDVARKAAAANGLSTRVSIVHRDAGLLQRGREVRPLGVNVVVADMFDAGLFGDGFTYLLELARRRVVQPDATVVPARATLYCMGVEVLTGEVGGLDCAEMNKYRWDSQYECLELDALPHRRLTRPMRVMDVAFDGEQRAGQGREGVLRLDVVAEGVLNAVAFWFDLHLDEEETLTNAPGGIGEGGCVLDEQLPQPPPQQQEEEAAVSGAPAPAADAAPSDHLHTSAGDNGVPPPPPPPLPPAAAAAAADERGPGGAGPRHYWGQALQYLDRQLRVEPGRRVLLLARREEGRMRFALRQGVGEWVGRPPWKVEWGGGASIENPHVQRVHYCELLVRDFLQRVRCKRFPPIEQDMRMVLAHAGSLFLDAAALQEVSHELVVMEKIHAQPEFSPAATLEALTRRPMRMH